MTDRANQRVVKRSLVIARHRTSVSLEDAFWRRPAFKPVPWSVDVDHTIV